MLNKIKNNLGELIEYATLTREKSGKSFFQQFQGIRYLKKINPTCGISDYYRYGLYDNEFIPKSVYRNFLGWKARSNINFCLNPRRVVAPAWDKLLFMILLESYKLEYPKLKALYKENTRFPSIPGEMLSNIDQLKEFLQKESSYPLYAKPVDCQQGLGGFYLTGFNPETNSVITNDGSEITFDSFIKQSINNPYKKYYRKEAGYLFQDVIPQHPDVNAFQGHTTISSIRLVTINTDRGPIVHRAVWKLCVGNNPNDNFSLGKYGNLVAQIDITNGSVQYATDALWPYATRYYKHPTTDIALSDFRIPNWDLIAEETVKASSIIPSMNIKHWDIAIGPDGPIYIELNDIGGTEILQINSVGLIDDNLIQLLRDKGNYRGYKVLRELVDGWDRKE